MKGLAVLGELTPRSIDAISQLRRAPLQLHRHAGLPPFRHGSRARGFAPRHRHRPAPHAGRAAFSRNLRAPRRDRSAAGRASSVVVMGGFIGVHRGRRHHHARPRRFGLHRVHRGRGHRRRGDPDLDRCGRHAHRRSHDSARRPSRQDHFLRRSRGAGLLRREGAASGHRGSGRRKEHSGADPEFAPARSAEARASCPKRCPATTW